MVFFFLLVSLAASCLGSLGFSDDGMVPEVWYTLVPNVKQLPAVVEKPHHAHALHVSNSTVFTKCDVKKMTLTMVVRSRRALDCGGIAGSSHLHGGFDQKVIVEAAIRACLGSEDDPCLLKKLLGSLMQVQSLGGVCSSLREVERGLETSLAIFCHEEEVGASSSSCAGCAVVLLVPAGGSGVTGILTFVPGMRNVRIVGKVTGLSAGKHGFTVYEGGSTGNSCMDAGGHFNPDGTEHSGPDSDWEHRHAGDLGNIIADVDGVTFVDIVDTVITLGDGGPRDVNTRSIVVHADEDDLGLGTGDLEEESKRTGNAGARLACGVIQTFKTLHDDH